MIAIPSTPAAAAPAIMAPVGWLAAPPVLLLVDLVVVEAVVWVVVPLVFVIVLASLVVVSVLLSVVVVASSFEACASADCAAAPVTLVALLISNAKAPSRSLPTAEAMGPLVGAAFSHSGKSVVSCK